MLDREKVVNGLECCCNNIKGKDCAVCPYEDESWDTDKCVAELTYQALQLLKEQEAVEPDTNSAGTCTCGNCGETVGYYPAGCKTPKRLCRCCPECGKAVKWDDK